MKILVTGGAGFIGSAVVRLAVAARNWPGPQPTTGRVRAASTPARHMRALVPNPPPAPLSLRRAVEAEDVPMACEATKPTTSTATTAPVRNPTCDRPPAAGAGSRRARSAQPAASRARR